MITTFGGATDCTAFNAFTMPAPQRFDVQLQGEPFTLAAFGSLVATHAVVSGCGKAVAVVFNRVVIVVGVRLALAPSINAIVPETIGAEKLVPRFGFN